jgi:oxygen-independent coproporphyrinogen-3 oxidase
MPDQHVLELVRKYDRPGPRYTSYPTAAVFHDGVDDKTYAHHLSQAAARVEDPLSLYVHLPFCRHRCWYCGCNVVVTSKAEVEQRYRESVLREVADVATRLGERRQLSQLHWGGGTPTYGTPSDLARFHRQVLEHFELAPGAEVAVEVDPRVTTREHLQMLAEGGFNRLSAGVQDLDPSVQAAIGRNQDYEATHGLIEGAREVGFTSINIDLIYGLPEQTTERFAHTLEKVIELLPARVALYAYAHMPSMLKHQCHIDEAALPAPAQRLALFEQATDAFRAAGYVSIGFDHFARPEDELSLAATSGRLGRNFMGYTVRAAPDLIGVGESAIGDVGGAYVQNHKKLIDYQRAVDGGQLATARGVVLSDDDLLRRHVINALMVNWRVDFHEVEAQFGVRFTEVFQPELEELGALAEDGLVEIASDAVRVTELGKRLVRNICMPFDAYLGGAHKGRYSRTI